MRSARFRKSWGRAGGPPGAAPRNSSFLAELTEPPRRRERKERKRSLYKNFAFSSLLLCSWLPASRAARPRKGSSCSSWQLAAVLHGAQMCLIQFVCQPGSKALPLLLLEKVHFSISAFRTFLLCGLAQARPRKPARVPCRASGGNGASSILKDTAKETYAGAQLSMAIGIA